MPTTRIIKEKRGGQLGHSSPRAWSVTELAAEFAVSREDIAGRLRGTPPSVITKSGPAWYMADAIEALARGPVDQRPEANLPAEFKRSAERFQDPFAKGAAFGVLSLLAEAAPATAMVAASCGCDRQRSEDMAESATELQVHLAEVFLNMLCPAGGNFKVDPRLLNSPNWDELNHLFDA